MRPNPRYLLFAVVVLMLASCSAGGRKCADDYRLKVPDVPSTVPMNARLDYIREHFWDQLDFSDTTFVHIADSADMRNAFILYVRFIGPRDTVGMERLMARASHSRPTLDYFSTLAECVLHDPNSHFRSDELYIPVLRTLIASPFLDEYEKEGPRYDLKVASLNRVGRMSNDFRYTLRGGRVHRMHDIRADYTILFINNPGCPMCRDVIDGLRSSRLIDSLQDQGRLKVLAIYPDEDLGEWRRHMPDMDPRWINAYDSGCVISSEELYDLKAIPALYLLSADKTVLVKDSTSVPELEQTILHEDGSE